MLEETVSIVPSIWSSVNSWFTPAVLFLFLNLMIATIALTSGFVVPHEPYKHTNNNQLARSPSVLQRLKSINLFPYKTPKPPPKIETRFSLKQQQHNGSEEQEEEIEGEYVGHVEAETSDREEEEPSMDDVYGMIQGQRVRAGEVPVVRKSASPRKLGFSDFEADDDVIERRWPATVREGMGRPRAAAVEQGVVDHEVDAKADDFINRFRQQLQLQV